MFQLIVQYLAPNHTIGYDYLRQVWVAEYDTEKTNALNPTFFADD